MSEQDLSVCPALICSLDIACLQIPVRQRKDLHTGRKDTLCLCAALRVMAASLGLNEAQFYLPTCVCETEIVTETD